MSRIHVPYLAKKPGVGDVPRWYWTPGPELRQAGFRTQRVPDDWRGLTDPVALEASAIAKAKELNAGVKTWRDNAAAGASPKRRANVPVITVDEAIEAFKLSRYYKRLRDSTRRTYDQNLAIISKWSAAVPWRAITAKSVEEFYMAMQPNRPTLANGVIGMLRILLSYTATGKLRQPNAASAPGLIGVAPTGRIWPREAVTLFVETADEMGEFGVGTAVLFNEWLGQREGDLIRLKPPPLADGKIILRQRKRGAGVKLSLDIVPHLATRLAAELARTAEFRKVVRLDRDAALPLVLDRRGRPYNEKSFQKKFAEVRTAMAKKRASFPVDYIVAGSDEEDNPMVATLDLQAMHLRHTAVVRLAEANVDDKGIAPITGHSLAGIKRVLERYLVRTGELAASAFRMRLAKENGNG